MSTLNIGDRDYTFKMGQYFSRGWEIFKVKALPFVGYTALAFIVLGLLSFILPYPLGSGNPDAEEYGGNIIASILSPLFGAGLWIVALQAARNRATSFSDFFQGFSRAWPVLLLTVVSNFLITLGTLLLVLPGIYLAVAYLFNLPLLLDKNLSFWNAMETSRKIITKKWFAFFGFVLLLALVLIGGILALGVGLWVAIPYIVCTIVAAYEDIVGLNSVSDAPMNA